MSAIRVTVRQPSGGFRPGSRVEGEVHWPAGERRQAVDLHLLWFTEREEPLESGLGASVSWPADAEGLTGTYSSPFLPSPFSFQGRLFSINWVLEVLVNGRSVQRVPLVYGPGGESVAAGESSPPSP